MLFSHPEIAKLMNNGFECAWESVRPVPRASIDFGNGRRLERTLHGNIATYFCTPKGEVFDVLPGLVDASEYLRRLDQAQRLNRGFRYAPAGSSHPGNPSASPAVTTGHRQVALAWHEALVERQGDDSPLQQDPIPVFDGSKLRIERKLDEALSPPLAAADAEALRQDTHYNRVHRYPLASRLMLEQPFRRPAEITNEVFRRVLDVDLTDPYLGLAPDVIGGEGGRL